MNVMPQLSLEEQMVIAERDLMCARMIDNTNRMWAEVAECERRVEGLQKQIEARDAG